MAERDDSVEQWAKRAEFSQPIRWGEVEAAILAMPQPSFDPEPEFEVTRAQLIIGNILRAVLWLVYAVIFGSSVIGLVFIVVGVTAQDSGAAQEWVAAAVVPFVAAMLVHVVMGWLVWSQIRRRVLWMILLIGGSAVVSLGSYLVLRTVPELLDIGWTTWVIVAAACTGFVVLALMLFASKPGHGLPRQPRRKMTREEKLYAALRAQVLRILIKRGLVDEDEIDVPELVEARLGSWHLLDLPTKTRP